jgi:site-specific DNA recombinase
MPNGRPGAGQANRERREIRCAVYTRKSTEEGLDQEFNSLDAQREAAEAYIQSQRSEGWTLLPDRYDDGGCTGANVDRPALQRLLQDVGTRRVDVVVVYKVDRLSRSLLDFARLMEVFEAHDVSFVSVTQQFNTATSVGRLMLNVLLSFAQFEREIIGERTRDKIAAARRRGKWTGGVPVLGYDVAPEGGRLVVNAEEAERVRAIFDLYLEHRGLIPVVEELARRGWRNKRYVTREGKPRGGGSFTKTTLHSLLRNPLYAGKVRSDGSLQPGEHEAIVDERAWQRVQRVLRRNGHKRRNGNGRSAYRPKPLLGGLLYCQPCGEAMTQSVAVRGKRRHRYYVCLNAQKNGWASCPTKSVAAERIEASVVEQLRGLCVTGNGHASAGSAPSGNAWETLTPAKRRRAIHRLVERIDYDGPSCKVTAVLRDGDNHAHRRPTVDSKDDEGKGAR